MAVKTAKDLAFDKERAKYKKRIKELERTVKEKEEIIAAEKEKNSKKETKILELQDWVNRLLDFTELSKEDMKKIIKNEKENIEIKEHIDTIINTGRIMKKLH